MVIKNRPGPGRLSDWLSDPANFAEALFDVDGAPVRLDPWQADLLSSDAKLSVLLKSRRVGGSWAMTARMFIRSQTIPRYSGVFVSMNREEARGKIEYTDEMHESLPGSWKLKRVARSKDEIVFIDSRGRRSTLKSLAAKAPRGRGGDVGISELPHCLNAKSIYEGALHVTARKQSHQLTVESTPLGKGGPFYDLCRGRYPQFRRYEIPWWLCSALCVDIENASIEAPAMTTVERVTRFGRQALQSIYSSMPQPAFKQESELEFIEMESAAFSMELLLKCAEPEFGDTPNSHLVFRRVNGVPSDSDWAWLGHSRKGALMAGYDPARKNDKAALVIVDKVKGKMETRMIAVSCGLTFRKQKEIIDTAIKSGVSSLRIDSTGMGMDISERLEAEYPETVKGVTFTAKSKQKMIAGAYNALTDMALVLPADRDLLKQIGSIREEVSDSGTTVYRSPSGADGPGDMAWALLLAIEAARGVRGEAVLSYESVSRRGRWSAL